MVQIYVGKSRSIGLPSHSMLWGSTFKAICIHILERAAKQRQKQHVRIQFTDIRIGTCVETIELKHGRSRGKNKYLCFECLCAFPSPGAVVQGLLLCGCFAYQKQQWVRNIG